MLVNPDDMDWGDFAIHLATFSVKSHNGTRQRHVQVRLKVFYLVGLH
jgi:hypothetical protein